MASRGPARALMFQGTGSDVGKSTLVAGLCRLARRRGLSVAPFKPQNMSNNAAVCPDGGEIGRAQALQARAAGIDLHVDLNPVLLKPQSDMTAQVVLQGRVVNTLSAREYMNDKRAYLMDAVVDSFSRLTQQHDLVLIEGAGSASEVNLRERDLANMGFARRVNAPVCLIGDIDRGGVIASIVGTKTVIDPADAQLISSFIINRFRGDPTLFEQGVTAIEEHTGWPCHGVVPWIPSALRLPQEDAVVLDTGAMHSAASAGAGADLVRIAVPMLSRIANFDDLDPLRMEPGVELGFIPPGQHIPQECDVIILPGTKSTVGDLEFLRAQGWDHDITAFARNGGRVTGICGGYQLLGTRIHDPDGIDGTPGSTTALGLLNVETRMQPEKRTRVTQGRCTRSGLSVAGYEIHAGITDGPDTHRPMARIDERPDGAINAQGNVEGSYLHGLFGNDPFRSWWLNGIRAGSSAGLNYEATVERELDNLADALDENIDVDALLDDAREVSAT